jgi:hypothetical protein
LRLSFVNLNGGSRRTSMLYHIAKLKTWCRPKRVATSWTTVRQLC